MKLGTFAPTSDSTSLDVQQAIAAGVQSYDQQVVSQTVPQWLMGTLIVAAVLLLAR